MLVSWVVACWRRQVSATCQQRRSLDAALMIICIGATGFWSLLMHGNGAPGRQVTPQVRDVLQVEVQWNDDCIAIYAP